MIAPAINGRRSSRESRAATTAPPADSPKIVMRAGSPPNRAMLRCVQRSASAASARPRLRGASGSTENPSAPSR